MSSLQSHLQNPLSRRTMLPIAGMALAAPLVGSALPAAAQGTPESGYDQPPPSIVVTGVGRINLTPDIAYVTVGVSITGEDLTVAQAEATSVAEGILEVASTNDIAPEDVQTSSYSVQVYEEYDDDGNRTGDRTFEVSNMVTVTLRDIDAVGAVLGQLVDAGANTVYGISFSVADPGPPAQEARAAAAVDARQRADAYATGLGVEIIGIQSVSEFDAPQPAAREMDYAADAVAESSAAPVPVAAGSTTISVSVQVVFLISG